MTDQLTLADGYPAGEEDFGGATYSPKEDYQRLSKQVGRVYHVMRDGKARTLTELQQEIERRFGERDPQASLSARLRDLRKEQFGGHRVVRQRIEGGLYSYRMEGEGE